MRVDVSHFKTEVVGFSTINISEFSGKQSQYCARMILPLLLKMNAY